MVRVSNSIMDRIHVYAIREKKCAASILIRDHLGLGEEGESTRFIEGGHIGA